jgi:hypothetical protein
LKRQTDREAARRRSTEVHDVHDIRKLTDTGAIDLRSHRAPTRTEESTARE